MSSAGRLARLGARRDHPEEGMTLVASTPIIVIALMIVAGLVVDGGAQLKAKQMANMVASEACRSGGQEITPGSVTGQPVVLDVPAAQRAAQSYIDLTRSSSRTVTGSVQVEGTTLECRTTITFDTIFLGIIGKGEMTVHGDAEVDAVRAVDGVPE